MTNQHDQDAYAGWIKFTVGLAIGLIANLVLFAYSHGLLTAQVNALQNEINYLRQGPCR